MGNNKWKVLCAILIVVILVLGFGFFKSTKAVDRGLSWNFNSVSEVSLSYLDNYSKELKTDEKQKLLDDYSQDGAMALMAIEGMTTDNIMFKKYNMKEFSYFVLRLSEGKDAATINKKSELLKAACETLLKGKSEEGLNKKGAYDNPYLADNIKEINKMDFDIK